MLDHDVLVLYFLKHWCEWKLLDLVKLNYGFEVDIFQFLERKKRVVPIVPSASHKYFTANLKH